MTGNKVTVKRNHKGRLFCRLSGDKRYKENLLFPEMGLDAAANRL